MNDFFINSRKKKFCDFDMSIDKKVVIKLGNILDENKTRKIGIIYDEI